jgi:hypothetical protein
MRFGRFAIEVLAVRSEAGCEASRNRTARPTKNTTLDMPRIQGV